jgi:hypothetical protein
MDSYSAVGLADPPGPCSHPLLGSWSHPLPILGPPPHHPPLAWLCLPHPPPLPLPWLCGLCAVAPTPHPPTVVVVAPSATRAIALASRSFYDHDPAAGPRYWQPQRLVAEQVDVRWELMEGASRVLDSTPTTVPLLRGQGGGFEVRALFLKDHSAPLRVRTRKIKGENSNVR